MSYFIGPPAGLSLTDPRVAQGWGYWQDNANRTGNRQLITADTRALFTVDGLGENTNTDFLGDMPSSVYNGNTIMPNGVGNTYTVRIDYKASSNSVSQGEYCEVALDIGDGGVIEILDDRFDLAKGSGNTHIFSRTYQIFCLDTFNANGGKFYITPSISVDIWDRAISIHQGVQV